MLHFLFQSTYKSKKYPLRDALSLLHLHIFQPLNNLKDIDLFFLPFIYTMSLAHYFSALARVIGNLLGATFCC